jgi:hypothetical protein
VQFYGKRVPRMCRELLGVSISRLFSVIAEGPAVAGRESGLYFLPGPTAALTAQQVEMKYKVAAAAVFKASGQILGQVRWSQRKKLGEDLCVTSFW